MITIMMCVCVYNINIMQATQTYNTDLPVPLSLAATFSRSGSEYITLLHPHINYPADVVLRTFMGAYNGPQPGRQS